MRFAITACDRYLGVFEEFLHAGWEPVKLFSVPAKTALDSNRKVIELAQKRNINVQLSRMTEHDLQDLSERGCETLIVASYNWRIGNWRPFLKHAVNFHPSPLPEARGPYPMVCAILEEKKSWAVTCHKIEPAFDSGDLLATETFPLHDQECHESLNLKLQLASARLAGRVASQFSALWMNAVPQDVGDYWPLFGDNDRTLNFAEPVERILRRLRAFGVLECLASINGIPMHVERAIGWTEAHRHHPGTVVHSNNRTLLVAAADGYIALLEWRLAATDLSGMFADDGSLV